MHLNVYCIRYHVLYALCIVHNHFSSSFLFTLNRYKIRLTNLSTGKIVQNRKLFTIDKKNLKNFSCEKFNFAVDLFFNIIY